MLNNYGKQVRVATVEETNNLGLDITGKLLLEQLKLFIIILKGYNTHLIYNIYYKNEINNQYISLLHLN